MEFTNIDVEENMCSRLSVGGAVWKCNAHLAVPTNLNEQIEHFTCVLDLDWLARTVRDS